MIASASYSPRLESSRAQRARGAGERRSARHVTPESLPNSVSRSFSRRSGTVAPSSSSPLYERDKTVAPVQRTVDRPEEANVVYILETSTLSLARCPGITPGRHLIVVSRHVWI